MNEPLMTVVMSSYNQEKYISEAIESVLMQKTDFPVRLIVTDDHSTKDGTVEIIRRYAAKYPDRIVALLNGENGRYLKNVLRAMAQVKSEYYTLLDADDYWTDPNYLADAVAFLKAHPEHTVYGRCLAWRREDGSSGRQFPETRKGYDADFEEFMRRNLPSPLTPAAVFRNVIFREGVPDFLLQAVGTSRERPFDGDVFRFFQHLDRGRAFFENKISGVYRMSDAGIFMGMSPVKRHFIQAWCFILYARHFGRARRRFLKLAWRQVRAGLRSLIMV